MLQVKDFIFIILSLLMISILIMESPNSALFCLNIYIFCVSFLYVDRRILNPQNVILAFFLLYVCLPNLINFFYAPEVKLLFRDLIPLWTDLSKQTIRDIFLQFSIFVILFRVFDFQVPSNMPNLVGNLTPVVWLGVISTIVLNLIFLNLSGGFYSWLYEFSDTFIRGRRGLGALNFIYIYTSNLTAFILGLFFFGTKRTLLKNIILISLILIFIFFVAYFQGSKSRPFELLLLFSFPLIIKKSDGLQTMLAASSLFIILFLAANFLRAEGLESFQARFVYLTYYFNAFPLHDLILTNWPSGNFSTNEVIFFKYMKNILPVHYEISDLSSILTQVYFPEDFKAYGTQQWPLATYFYLNTNGFIGGAIFILSYVIWLKYLQVGMTRGSIGFSYIYIIEILRVFTVQRGEIIPWQFLIHFSFCFASAYLLSHLQRNYFENKKGV